MVNMDGSTVGRMAQATHHTPEMAGIGITMATNMVLLLIRLREEMKRRLQDV